MGEAHRPLHVNDEEAGPLPQGRGPAVYPIAVKDFAGGVHQQRERQRVLGQLVVGCLERGVGNGQDLGARSLKVAVVLRQLAEVPAAKGSEEPPKEEQDDASLASEVG